MSSDHSAVFDLPPKPTSASSRPVLVVADGDPRGHALAICRARLADADERIALVREVHGEPPTAVKSGPEGDLVSTDLVAIARTLAPDLFPTEGEAKARHEKHLTFVRRDLLEAVETLGRMDDQAAYESAHRAFRGSLERVDETLGKSRFLLGDSTDRLTFADVLLFAFSVRIDPVYYELYKANPFLLADLPSLHAFCCDLYELPEFHSTTDWEVVLRHHYEREAVLNPRGIVPRGGRPNLDVPQHRASAFGISAEGTRERGVGEVQGRSRASGEWVRGRSDHRNWISPDPDATYPAEAGRYHLYAPYNCPWSHRALLGRSVKGLTKVLGASVLYFRRHPEKGWQFNPAIPGCTDDPVRGAKYLAELYEAVGSDERSAPVLWDTKTDSIVSNESADMLRMFDSAFGAMANDLILVPDELRDEIDGLNEIVYQRINNGAYKAGFAKSQHAYDRAFDRYFAAFDWLEERLADRAFLLGTEHPTEADLRLFPTVFRHDAVYYARFKLNRSRLSDLPMLSAWHARMLAWPGVAEASNLDHARNGYFGRTGNGIVPLGPVPLGLSPASYPASVWLGEHDPPE